MRSYIALIHKDAESDYGVSFPDLPGCVTAASTLDDVVVMATEALALHLQGLWEDGQPAPEPSSLDHVIAHCEDPDGVTVLLTRGHSPTASAP